MGCSQSSQSVILSLTDEIKILHQKKSQIILELDALKEQNKFFSMTEEEKNMTKRRLSSDLITLQSEYERLENLNSQISGLSSKIEHLDADLKIKSELAETLSDTCEKAKNRYLQIVEVNNKIINESSDLSFEHTKKSKHAHSYSFAQQENNNLQEKISDLEENLKKLQAAEDLIAENELKIRETEEKIVDTRPLIQAQNEKHAFLLKIQNEIQALKHVLTSVSLTSSEKKFESQLLTTLSMCSSKSKKLSERLESLNSINLEDLKSQKETQTLIRQTLKSDLKSSINQANQLFIELCQLQSKKTSFQLDSTKKVTELEDAYQQACRKIQKKESQKVNLEKELKEYQDILKELDFK